MNLNETIFGKSYLVAKTEYVDGKSRLKNITLMDYMRELNFIDHPGPVDNLAVVWYYGNDSQHEEIFITQIYDHDTGEIYWEDPSDDEWTDNDDELTNSLLMFGGLENTIGELYY